MSIVRYDTRMREASHLPPKASSLGQFLFFRPVFTVTGLILMKWNFRSYICYKLVDCLEKCLIYGHIRRFAN